MTRAADWCSQVREAGDVVNAWMERIDAAGWTAPRGAAWNNKDLLGHLAAWSNLLIDQLEALVHDSPHSLAAVDVDRWNDEQVAARRAWPPIRVVEEWQRAIGRALQVLEALPPDAGVRLVPVTWARAPVSVDDVVRLWVAHVTQHRARLEAWT
jgi:hypothetical protein